MEIIKKNTVTILSLTLMLTIFAVPSALGASTANIDQCRDGGIGLTSQPCNDLGSNSSWANGDLNGQQAHYAEGQFVPYRVTLTGITNGMHNIQIEYITVKTQAGVSKHAIDYLGSFNATETIAMGNNPCGDQIPSCDPAVPDDTKAIPSAVLNNFPPASGLDTFTGTQIPGNFAIWGGTFTTPVVYVSQNTPSSSDFSTIIRINFTTISPTNSATVVIAWGGHIASANDWGIGNSSSFISGSPYHMILDSFDGKSIGSQDRALATSAVLPTVTVIKHVINDDGGTAVASDFTMNVSSSISPSFPGNESGTTVTVNTGSYTVTEKGPSGYNASFSAGCTGSLKAGYTVICTVTNDDNPATLTLIKNVINDDGGAAGPNDFGISVNGTTVTSGVATTVNANTPIVINETGLVGYSFVNITGTGCPASLGGTIILEPGQSATCTITNDDIAPRLKVIKHVINDDGGTAVASDFIMNVAGTSVSTSSFPGDESGTIVTLNAGNYNVTETGPSGYSNSSSPDCSGTIAIGETKTCTITNDDIAPRLTVIKHVINDDGGTNVSSDFTINVNGTNVSTSSFPGNESGTTVTLNAGSYNVTETGPSGYSSISSLDCSGTIAVGQSATCTITNDDIAPELIVIKHVINDDGGTAVASDFTMNVTGTNVSSPTFPGNETGTTVTLNAGIYDVTEIGSSGYSNSSSGDCSGTIAVGEIKTCTIINNDIAPTLTLIKNVINDDGGAAGPNDFGISVNGTTVTSGVATTVNANTPIVINETGLAGYSFVSITGTGCPASLGGTITLEPGQSATCTITNDDIAPELIVIKHVINDDGGTNVSSDFTMNVAGTNVSTSSFPGNESGTTVTLNAGTYNVTETGPSGYSNSSSSDCLGSIAVGETKTCTITNDDIAPRLTVIKHVINDDGGTAVASDFTMNIFGTNVSTSSFPGNESGTTVTLNAGSYSVTETGSSGYSNNSSSDCSGTIAIGEIKTCTIINDDIAPKQKTETQGFWATHLDATNATFSINLSRNISFAPVCSRDVNSTAKLMGGFWSDVSYKTTGQKRTQLDQARMQLAQQLLAAILNGAAFGSSPGPGVIDGAKAAFCGKDRKLILNYTYSLDSFNNAGENTSFPPGFNPGTADSRATQAIANKTFWDSLP